MARARVWVAAGSVAALAALALSGCGSQIAPSSDPTTSATARSSLLPVARPPGGLICPGFADPEHGWDAAAATPSPEPLPSDWAPVTVVRCHEEVRATASDGDWSVLIEERADRGIEALVAAMRLPSEPVPTDIACTADYQSTPWFAFLDSAGAVLHAQVPRTQCGKPSPAVIAALDALDVSVVAETRITQVTAPERAALDQQAEALGCSSSFKDMMAIDESDGGDLAGPGGTPFRVAPRSLVLCRYEPDPQDPQVGLFVAGRKIAGEALGPVLDALADTAPGKPCAKERTGFVGLFPATNNYVLIEVGGCGRVYADPVPDARDSYRFGQASPTLIAALG